MWLLLRYGWRGVLLALVLAGSVRLGMGAALGTDDLAASDYIEGGRLAAQLRGSPPAEELNLKGRLSIRDATGSVHEVPFEFRTMATPTNWMAIYRSRPAGTNDGAHNPLAVVHWAGQPNSYWQSTQAQPEAWQPLPAGEAYERSFGGSDFSIQDLGLEFLHWPKQRLIRTEMRKSRSCHVLESTNPRAGASGYSRVVSWLDVESGGLLLAEAYDRREKLLKEFAVNSMKKVDQRWQVQQMEIRNVQQRTRTRLEFEVK